MKQNTHDWDAIRCRRGTLLLIEMVIPTGNGADFGVGLDRNSFPLMRTQGIRACA